VIDVRHETTRRTRAITLATLMIAGFASTAMAVDPGIGVGKPGVGVTPGVGVGAPGVVDPGVNQPGVVGNVGGVARHSIRR
jgi:hypothetical protein